MIIIKFISEVGLVAQGSKMNNKKKEMKKKKMMKMK